jgi:hypothetical protein
LRGLYVDYSEGTVHLPDEITEQETLPLLDCAQQLLDQSKATWDAPTSGRMVVPAIMDGTPYLALFHDVACS